MFCKKTSLPIASEMLLVMVALISSFDSQFVSHWSSMNPFGVQYVAGSTSPSHVACDDTSLTQQAATSAPNSMMKFCIAMTKSRWPPSAPAL
jgi:hypothetical protein